MLRLEEEKKLHPDVSTADFLQSSSVFWDWLIVEPAGHFCHSHLRWRLGASWEPSLLDDLQKCHMTMMCHPISWLIQVCHPIYTGRVLAPDCSTCMWKHGTKKNKKHHSTTHQCTHQLSVLNTTSGQQGASSYLSRHLHKLDSRMPQQHLVTLLKKTAENQQSKQAKVRFFPPSTGLKSRKF